MSPPCATLDVSAEAVTLHAPGPGRVRVTAAEITWQATDGVGGRAGTVLLGGIERYHHAVVCRFGYPIDPDTQEGPLP